MTAFGVAVAFFLALAQAGLMIGWINTTTAIIRRAGADLWVVAEQTPSFDYGTSIPRHRLFQARSIPGVQWAEGMVMTWNYWQRPDGKRVNIELVGLDKANVGGPWEMVAGEVSNVHRPQMVLVDELYAQTLGVETLDQSVGVNGERAIVGGISRGIRTFTAAPFVFTSIDQAIFYDKRMRQDEITYVLLGCAPGADPIVVQQRLRASLDGVEVLTRSEFAVRSARYWMLETGLGFTVVITGLLGLAVGGVIMSQTLYAMTQESLPSYATLLALGFTQARLMRIVLFQGAVFALLGILLGTGLFLPASIMSARTPVPLEITPAIYLGIAGLSIVACGGASLLSIRGLFRLDPVLVFHA